MVVVVVVVGWVVVVVGWVVRLKEPNVVRCILARRRGKPAKGGEKVQYSDMVGDRKERKPKYG